MAAGTVLSTTQTNVISYTSSVLTVGNYSELAIDVNVTSASGGTVNPNTGYIDYVFQVFRIDALGNPFLMNDTTPMYYSDYGSNVAPSGQWSKSYGLNTNISTWSFPVSFGGQVQVQLLNSSGCTLSFTLSIIGK